MKLSIRTFTDEDLPAIGRLLREQIVTSHPLSAEEHSTWVRWQSLENPELGGCPSGWVLEDDAGGICGLHLCIPKLFQFPEGSRLVIFPSSYYVTQEARGKGGVGLLMNFRKQLTIGPLINSTPNLASAELWYKMGAVALPNTGHEFCKFFNWSAIAEEWLARRLKRTIKFPWVGRGSGQMHGVSEESRFPNELSKVREISEMELAAAANQGRSNIHPLRSPEWLTWKYLRNPDASVALYRWQDSAGAWYFGTNIRKRGHRGQIRTLQIGDCWGSGDLTSLRRGLEALFKTHRKKVAAVSLRGYNPAVSVAQKFLRKRSLEVPFLVFCKQGREDTSMSWEVGPDHGG